MSWGFAARMGVRMESKLAFSSVPSKPSTLMPSFSASSLKYCRDALAVGGLVVEDIGALDALGCRELGAHRALDVVAAADAVHFHVAAVGDLGVGVGGGDVDEAGGVVLLGGGDLDAGIVVADDPEDRGIRDDALRVGDAGVGIALVVEGRELDLEPELCQGSGELLDGELGAVLDVGADRGHAAREGALRGDLDDLGLGRDGHGGHAEHRYQGHDEENSLSHLHYLLLRSASPLWRGG